jgi:hypothetical protein
VAAWDSDEQVVRTRFVERIYEFAGALPQGSGLRIVLAAIGARELDLSFELLGPAADDQPTLDSLANLLDDPDSPVQTVVDALRRSNLHEVADEVILRQPLFSADTPSRQRPVQSTYDPAQDLRGLCAALLEVGAAAFLVEVRPVERTAKVEDLARSLGPDTWTPQSLSDSLRHHGSFVRATVRVSSRTRISSRLHAELHRLATPIEVVEAARLGGQANGRVPRPDGRQDMGRPPVVGVRSLAALFRLPVACQASFPGFDVVPAPYVRAPLTVTRGAGRKPLRLGTTLDSVRNVIDVGLDLADFSRHVYVPGQTGAGKSTMLRAIACAVAEQGHGLLFVDPHGETASELLRELPPGRMEDVVFVDAADLKDPAPMNPFAVSSDLLQRDTALANVTEMFHDIFDPSQQGIVGPRWEAWFRMAMLTLLEARRTEASLLDVPSLFLDKTLLESLRPSFQAVDYLVDFWDREMKQTSEYHRSEILGWFTSKFTAFRTNAVLREILGSGHDVLDPLSVMDDGRIVVVSLAKGEIGGPVAQMLGYLYLSRYWTAALKRRSNKPFALFVDEAQTFSKGALPSILAEGRKFGLACVLANQYLEQLPESLQHALLGNVGTVVAFRLGDRDAQQFAGRLGPEFGVDALRRLPNLQTACSLLLDGAVQPAFTLDVDHYTRVRFLRTAADMRRQEMDIKRASRNLLRDAKVRSRRRRSDVKHSPKPSVADGPAQDASAGNGLRRLPVDGVDGALANQPHPSFVDALSAKLAGQRQRDQPSGDSDVQA